MQGSSEREAIEILKIFVSSVIEGLEKERKLAERAIKDLILEPDQFEIFPAYPHAPKEICLERVKECDIFILILKDRLSDIVLEEFQTAEKNGKEILIFIKKDPHNKKLKDFLKGTERDYTYKQFSTLKEFEIYLKKSIQYLLVHTFKSLKKNIKIKEKCIEILTEQIITVGAFEKKWFEYYLEKGDLIEGIVREVKGDSFNVYFMNEEIFSDYLNDEEVYCVGDESIKSYSLNEEIKKDGAYYLVFTTNAILFDRSIYVKIRKIK